MASGEATGYKTGNGQAFVLENLVVLPQIARANVIATFCLRPATARYGVPTSYHISCNEVRVVCSGNFCIYFLVICSVFLGSDWHFVRRNLA